MHYNIARVAFQGYHFVPTSLGLKSVLDRIVRLWYICGGNLKGYDNVFHSTTTKAARRVCDRRAVFCLLEYFALFILERVTPDYFCLLLSRFFHHSVMALPNSQVPRPIKKETIESSIVSPPLVSMWEVRHIHFNRIKSSFQGCLFCLKLTLTFIKFALKFTLRAQFRLDAIDILCYFYNRNILTRKEGVLYEYGNN